MSKEYVYYSPETNEIYVDDYKCGFFEYYIMDYNAKTWAICLNITTAYYVGVL